MKNNKAYVKVGQTGEIELYKFIEKHAASEEELVNAYVLAFQCQAARLSSAYGKEGVEEMIKKAFEFIETAKIEHALMMKAILGGQNFTSKYSGAAQTQRRSVGSTLSLLLFFVLFESKMLLLLQKGDCHL